MKKNIIAILLAVVMASSSTGTVSALAAEPVVEESALEQGEGTEEDGTSEQAEGLEENEEMVIEDASGDEDIQP